LRFLGCPGGGEGKQEKSEGLPQRVHWQAKKEARGKGHSKKYLTETRIGTKKGGKKGSTILHGVKKKSTRPWQRGAAEKKGFPEITTE